MRDNTLEIGGDMMIGKTPRYASILNPFVTRRQFTIERPEPLLS
jgi:hypothetical protein